MEIEKAVVAQHAIMFALVFGLILGGVTGLAGVTLMVYSLITGELALFAGATMLAILGLSLAGYDLVVFWL